MSIRIDAPAQQPQATMKQRLTELSIFGGPASFAEPLHVGRPNVVGKPQILKRIGDILDRAWLTNDGQVVRQFESAVADYAQVRHCVTTCNGTLALQLAAQALGLTGEVVMPALTFVATPHSIEWQRGRAIFADVDPDTWTLSPQHAASRITSRTSGLIGVHLWGQTCDIPALAELAARHRLRLLFDASHALGCTFGGVPIGRFGDAETVSFHATKFVNAAEGGAVLTNDDALAEQLRQLRNFGFRDPGSATRIGTNAKMSEISAAIGLTSLEYADRLIDFNAQNHAEYRQLIGRLPGLSVRSFNAGERCNYQYVVMQVVERDAGLSRDDLLAVLRAENVLARRYFYPGCHRLEAYRAANARLSLPVTEQILNQVVLLPTGLAVGADEIGCISRILELALLHPREVQVRLAKLAQQAPATSAPAPTFASPHVSLPTVWQ